MGQGISVEADPAGLKELLSAGAGTLSHLESPNAISLNLTSSHHVKAWCFEARGRSVVEAPVTLCDRGGLFIARLHRSSSYIILHIRKSASSTAKPFVLAALNDFASEAGAICTPRGLAVPEIEWREFQVWPGHCYGVFVWHGRSTEPLFRAEVRCKAWELDSALRKSLPIQREFAESLRRAVMIRGCQDVAPREASTQASQELVRNSLLSKLTAAIPEKGRTQCPWPRLGRSVLEGERIPSEAQKNGFDGKEVSGEQPHEQRQELQGLSNMAKLTCGGGPPQVPSLSASMPAQTGRPVVPKLALGSLVPGPASPARQAVPLLSSPTASRSSVDSSEGMEVDEAESSSSSSRKRQRGDEDEELQRSPQTARGASNQPGPTFAAAMAAALAAPRSARDGVPQLSLPGKGQSSPKSSQSDANARDPRPANGRQTILGRSDAPALNLEDIHTPEEELISSYDPDNEENNYHLPDHLQRRLQLKHWRQVCSEVIAGALFISSYQVAGDEDALNACGITHIVNTAADVCDNCFPDKFQYLTYYLKDANSEDITVLLYRTLEWMHEAMHNGGRVLVHCREGVSRSATIVIAYLMWRYSLSFEAAHERIRQNRPICNPNTGFTCQLLQLAKRLSISQAAPISDRSSLFRVAPYHPKEPFLLLVPADCQSGQTHFDPRFGWVAQSGLQFVLWMGSQVPDADATIETVEAHKRRVEFFERCQCSILIVKEGEEVPQLWQVLGEMPPVNRSLVALRSEFDSDYEIMVSTSGKGAPAGHGTSKNLKDGNAWEGPNAHQPQPVLAVGS